MQTDTPATSEPSRRAVVRAGAVTLAGAGALAACGSDATPAGPGAAPSTAAPSTAAPSTTAVTSASASDGASPSGSASASSPPAPAEDALAALADIPVGGAIAVDVAGGPVVLARPTAGTVVGFSARCPHNGCRVAPAGATLNCPCHASKFETATGRVLNGPAKTDLKPFPVKVQGTSVVAG